MGGEDESEERVRKVKAPNEVPLANYVKGRKSMLLKCIRRQGITKGIVGPLLKRMEGKKKGM